MMDMNKALGIKDPAAFAAEYLPEPNEDNELSQLAREDAAELLREEQAREAELLMEQERIRIMKEELARELREQSDQ